MCLVWLLLTAFSLWFIFKSVEVLTVFWVKLLFSPFTFLIKWFGRKRKNDARKRGGH